ncbi:probable serine/threonine-protein kinase DDB_G0278665 [Paramacrobiotus metropolitanus]|uniref:probable serine/threonine-protein kinase DDB_G0278665 n=1 Tax=Paramacrobiotus metropolitanus TaxID=2943436 RepID=UPI0024464184|nr:probable serine/threonine-protein kinase DDB_G0278665 [Paramacrobiotus metropolitanus]
MPYLPALPFIRPWELLLENELPSLPDVFRQVLVAHETNGRRYDELSHTAYEIVSRQHGAELYEMLQGMIVEYLNQVREDVTQLSEDEFLAALNTTWNHFKRGLSLIKVITAYMDRAYVIRNELDNTENLGFRIFRDHVVYHEGIRERVRVNMLDNRRRDKIIDGLVLRNAYEMLIDLGKGTVEVYQEICEHPYLALYAHLLSSVQNMGSQEVCLYGRKQYHYNLLDYIGSGAFGRVFKAEVTNRVLQEEAPSVAVKVFPLRAKVQNDPAAWNDWCRRLRVLSELSHLNLVRYHKVAVVPTSDDRQVQIVMDLCNGGDLAKLLGQHREKNTLLEVDKAVCYAADIADGLNFLHYNNIIHGDLKPGNVLVQSDRLVIGDLDGSIPMQQFVTCTADAENLAGTLHYMAPEVLGKLLTLPTEEKLGRKVDIWSFGCILLDLAERVIGVGKKYLWKVNLDGTTIKKEIGANTTKFGYTKLLLNEGYSPFVDPDIPAYCFLLAKGIEKCLLRKPDDRSSAEELPGLLRIKTQPTIRCTLPRAEESNAGQPPGPDTRGNRASGNVCKRNRDDSLQKSNKRRNSRGDSMVPSVGNLLNIASC